METGAMNETEGIQCRPILSWQSFSENKQATLDLPTQVLE
jgi:hypothetical protein